MEVKSGVDAVLERAVDAGEVPGVVALAADDNGVVYQGAFGQREIAREPGMTLDTVFWIASMTKAVTSVAARQLVEQGKLHLDDPMAGRMPEPASTQVLEGFDPPTPVATWRTARRPAQRCPDPAPRDRRGDEQEPHRRSHSGRPQDGHPHKLQRRGVLPGDGQEMGPRLHDQHGGRTYRKERRQPRLGWPGEHVFLDRPHKAADWAPPHADPSRADAKGLSLFEQFEKAMYATRA